MRILVACEFSGVVREAFRCRGVERITGEAVTTAEAAE